ncbi:GerMN domain-containing protein [Paenibacillus wynnii]|uniref:GerMN domain-containing protein n=1 Tax=Paenibacillus wynnii TaxID=268407 RepID=UPI0027929C39|nr:GerMN domain-containing protein [Paenibacillus wynnii]MDQ0192925.1 spore germination protein GerM [Paenibacillus wynnii]
MKTKLGYAGLSILLLFIMSGCGEKPEASVSNPSQNSPAVVSGAGGNAVSSDGADNSAGEATAEPANSTNTADTGNAAPTEKPDQSKKSETIEVYYTDSQLMDLVLAKAEISYSASDEDSKYGEAFKALQVSENSDLVPLWGKIELKSIKIENGQLVLDIHKPIEAQLGAGGESFALSALAKTLFQFKEVESIEILLDGEKVESLMGHVDLEHPMTRDNS